MDGSDEAVGAREVELLSLALVGFVLGFPHTEAVVGLGVPVFQILHDDFFAGPVAFDALEDNFRLAVVALGGGDAGVGIDIPSEGGGISFERLPFEGIELSDDIVEGGFLSGRDTGIVGDDDPGIRASAPVGAEIAGEPNLGAVEFHVLVMTFIDLEDEVGAAEMLVLAMSGGVVIEVAGTEHVATAGFDVSRGDLEVIFGRRSSSNTENQESDGKDEKGSQENPGARNHTVPPERKTMAGEAIARIVIQSGGKQEEKIAGNGVHGNR